MNTNDLTTRVNNLENALNVMLEAVGDKLSPSQVQEVQEALNPAPKLSQSQQEAIDVALLRAYYGNSRYEAEFADFDASARALARWNVYG